MARIGKDANGRITLDGVPLERWDPRLWGSVGRNVTDISTRGSPGAASDYDPRYYYRSGQGTDSEGGGGMNDIYSLRPEYASRLNGRIQLGQAGVGGAGEITDEGLANAEYDPEFGVLVDPRYIKAPKDWEAAGPIVMAALGGAAAFGGAGLGNMVGENLGTPWDGSFGPGGGLDPETAAGAGGMGGPGLSDLSNINPADYNIPENLPQITPSDLSRFNISPSSSLGQRLLQAALANPLQSARILAAGVALAQGGGGSAGGITTTSGITPGGTVPTGSSITPATANLAAPGTSMVPASGAASDLSNFARERLDRYRTTFQPLEDLIVNEATTAGNPAMQEERANLAAEDVRQAFDRERKITDRSLRRGMVNPNGFEGAALKTQLAVGEGAAAPLAQNEARRAERDTGFARRMAAAGLGTSANAQGLSALTASGNLESSAADRAQRGTQFDARIGLDRERAIADDSYRREALNHQIQTGNQATNERRNQNIGAALYGAGRLADSDLGRTIGGGIMDFINGFAEGGRLDMEDGGDVEGPGTTTSDSIPARLSKDEFVLPAESVKLVDKLSPGLLEKLQALGLRVRELGKRMDKGETLEGEFSTVGD